MRVCVDEARQYDLIAGIDGFCRGVSAGDHLGPIDIDDVGAADGDGAWRQHLPSGIFRNDRAADDDERGCPAGRLRSRHCGKCHRDCEKRFRHSWKLYLTNLRQRRGTSVASGFRNRPWPRRHENTKRNQFCSSSCPRAFVVAVLDTFLTLCAFGFIIGPKGGSHETAPLASSFLFWQSVRAQSPELPNDDRNVIAGEPLGHAPWLQNLLGNINCGNSRTITSRRFTANTFPTVNSWSRSLR